MQQIANWLESLGLGEYAQRFADNDIDVSVLRYLTDQDLEKLGVSLGHRRKMLAAIAELDGAGPTTPHAAAEPNRQGEAERRQLTVMFCDLVGSTALSARLDPEDMSAVIAAYHAACAGIMPTYDGFIAEFLGDGIVAYFGYPRAHEDDAERAVRAGLDIIAAVARLEEPLAVRIGIATGLVVVGDLSGAGSSRAHAVVGETPNLAARLQALGEPGSIVIAASTRRLLGDLFDLHDLGRHQVKGITGPVAAWAVEGVSDSESRFEAVRTAHLTNLIGREDEIKFLMERQCLAWKGEGQIVLISGEPGIGKSRLAAALGERIAGQPHMRLRYQCSPYHANSTLHPFIAQLERAAGFKPDDPPGQMLDKLEAILAMATSRVQAVAPLFAALLSIPFGQRYPPLALSPTQQRRQTLAALLDQLEGLARQQPILLIFEDAHWADATSLELLDLTVERLRQLPVLALFTFRPEFEPPWVGLPNVSALTLGRLDRANVESMVTRVTAGRRLPAEVTEQIVVKTDGNPLFVEELTKAVLEADILVEDAAGYRLDGPLPPLAIPATLHDSLMARLDRLAPVKEIGQIGAAIGREFSYSLLRMLVGRDDTALKDALAQLEAAELLFRRGEPPDAIYSFKHALVRDTAYESLLKSRRQVLHRRIAEALRDRFPTVAETQPEVVAHHFTQAGLTEAAVEWWGKAGERAVRHAANREAIAHFRRALSLNETQPDSMGRLRTELAILSQLGPALMSVHGWAAPEAGAVFHRAGEVAQRLERSLDLAPPLVGLWLFHQARAQFARAEEISGELFGIARELNDPEVLLQAHHATWPTRFVRGLFADAAEHIDAGMAVYDEARHEGHRYIYMGHDPAVCALAIGASVQWLLGRPERAIRLERRAVELARRLRHAPSLAHALWFACESQIARGDTVAVTTTATELLTLCEEQRLPQPRATALMFLGWGLGRAGNVAEGTCLLEEGLGAWNRLGVRCYLPRWMCLLAENHLTAQRYAEGLVQVKQALAVAAESGEQWFVPHMHQVRAELLLHMQDGTEESPEAILRTAMDIACGQGAKGWELRAAVALARLWVEGGERWKAHDLLAPVLACFTEGLNTSDLKDAKELLETLN